jgi:hypothetical protein
MSTLEERALADSDDSDRFATSRVNDAITSLVSAANMAGKAMGERDRARLALAAMTAERDALRGEVERLELAIEGMATPRNLKREREAALATIERVRALLGDRDGPLWAVRGVREADIRAAMEPTS